jgi:hypothetical protein
VTRRSRNPRSRLAGTRAPSPSDSRMLVALVGVILLMGNVLGSRSRVQGVIRVGVDDASIPGALRHGVGVDMRCSAEDSDFDDIMRRRSEEGGAIAKSSSR